MTTTAVYVQDQVSIGEQLDITAGLRWTKLDVESNYTSGGIPFVNTDKTHYRVTPRIGATYRIVDGVSAFAGYSEGFQGVVAAFGITDPKPETSQSYEAGLKLFGPIPGLTGTVAVYQITRQNVRTADPVIPFASIQSGEQRARGFETDIIFEPNSALSILATYAYTDAEVTKDNTLPVGDRPTRVPEHSGRLAVRYRFEDAGLPGLEIGGGVTAVSDRELTLPNVTSVDGSVLLDAQASYDFGPASLSLSIVNLTDEDSFEPYQYLAASIVTPTQPRSAFVTLRTGF
jgi:iron complex outermembrane receptor protein